MAASLFWAAADLRHFEPASPAPGPDRNPADIGVTSPNTLLDYTDWSTAPLHCRQPAALLEQLRQAVLRASSVGDAKSCGAAMASDALAGSPELTLTCSLTAPQAGCSELYTARIWVERERGSLTDYKMKGFGWLRRSCGGSDAVYETVNRNMSRGTSITLDAVLDACRQ